MPGARLVVRRITPERVQEPKSVSVVVPCYNYARYLRQAVFSALDQRGVEVTVIIVDDASTDESLNVARAIAASEPRVTVIANSENAGPVRTFNRGLAAATGEFLVRLDADDMLTPGSLERSVALLQAFPSLGLVYGHPLHFADSPPAAREHATRWQVWRGKDWLFTRCVTGTNVITSPEVVMRKSVVDRVGGQRDLAHTHDMEMWFRIAAHSDIGYVAGADQAWHREHAASLSNKAEDPEVILREIADAFDVLFGNWSADDADPAPFRAASRQGVATQAIEFARRDIDRGALTDDARALLALAQEIESTVMETPSGKRVVAALHRAEAWPPFLARLAGALPRFGRRMRGRVARRRWASTGVYEPLRVEVVESRRKTRTRERRVDG
jgi:glycosyltransferase involved in cell wall biosynthesis